MKWRKTVQSHLRLAAEVLGDNDALRTYQPRFRVD
jgi:hypothetical protein